jgi:flagellar assembly factor FliW
MSATLASSHTTVDATAPDSDSLIVFPNGLVGQPDWKRFVLMTPEEDGTVQVLQSVEQAELALMVTNPMQIIANYSVPLSRDERAVLQLEADEQPTVLCTISIHNNLVTTNLVGPLVVNGRNRIGTQVVVVDSPYSTRHPVAQLGAQE